MQQRKCERKSVEMHSIKEKEHKSLRSFIERFNKESMEIKGATEDMRVSGFMHAIKNVQLIEILNNKVPDIVEEMMTRVRDFIRGKEAANLGKEIGPTSHPRDIKSWKQGGPPRSGFGPSSRNERRTSDGHIKTPYSPQDYRRREVFTALTKMPCEILSTEEVAKHFPHPHPMSENKERKHSDRFCEFHLNNGHNTNECYHLKRIIDEAVKYGQSSMASWHI